MEEYDAILGKTNITSSQQSSHMPKKLEKSNQNFGTIENHNNEKCRIINGNNNI